ncbi:hypothetical protein GIB67_015788 [Kingdonia uniflora]|uniref:Senescence domain-containing protein n=1 Tax=Kingdonia uniflora TaxID=39325 RepID=A0A7J7NUH5_9MAGN|nr:hypothetical protein GIB67_015788 [Kingdonia uniflora]
MESQSQNPNYKTNNSNSSLYPNIIQSNPESPSPFTSTPSSLYPTIDTSDPMKDSKPTPSPSLSSSFYPSFDMKDLVGNLFMDDDEKIVQNHHLYPPSAPVESVEEVMVKISGAIVHLIDKQYSVELATGDLTIVRLRYGDSVVAVLVRVGNEVQWPLAKDEASVKLDESHYFFSLREPKLDGSDDSDDEEKAESLLNYGVTIASKGQENSLKELDGVLEYYSSFSVQKVSKKSEVLDVAAAKDVSPGDLESEKKKEIMEERSVAYWTTLAPNVEDYSGSVAKAIAMGSGQLIKGILWCGDVTVDRLKWGDEFLKKRMEPCKKDTEVSPETLKRIKRVKRVSKMSEKVATGVLSGVVKVSGYFTSSVVNSKLGKKFFGLLPGEVVLASLDGFGMLILFHLHKVVEHEYYYQLDILSCCCLKYFFLHVLLAHSQPVVPLDVAGFDDHHGLRVVCQKLRQSKASKVCDAVEVAGKNVMSTTSVVTTGLVSHKHGEQAAMATNQGFDAAGHAIGTAWAVFKIRKAFNPKSVIKPSTLAKAAAKDMKSKSKKIQVSWASEYLWLPSSRELEHGLSVRLGLPSSSAKWEPGFRVLWRTLHIAGTRPTKASID